VQNGVTSQTTITNIVALPTAGFDDDDIPFVQGGTFVGGGPEWAVGIGALTANSQTGVPILHLENGGPETPPANGFYLTPDRPGNRPVLRMLDAQGQSWVGMHPSLMAQTIWYPTTATAGLWTNTVGAGSGTFSVGLPTATSVGRLAKRGIWNSVVTTANQNIGQGNTEAMFFVGDHTFTPAGDFLYFHCRFVIENWTAGNRLFVGLSPTAAPCAAQPSAMVNCMGLGMDSTDTTLQFMSNDAAGAAVKTDAGIAAATGGAYDFHAYYVYNQGSPSIEFGVWDVGSHNSLAATSQIGNLPTVNTMMRAGAFIGNAANAPVNSAGIGVMRIYVETMT
jgi:hypothetical protein